MKRLVIAILLLLLVIIQVSPISKPLLCSNDGSSHYEMAKNPDYNSQYPPLTRLLSQFFSFRASYYSFFVLFLFIVVLPLLIYHHTKTVFSVWFFFSISSLIYTLFGGLFAEGLLLIIFLALFLTNNFYVQLGLVFIGVLSHSQGIILLPFTLALIYLEPYLLGWFSKVKFGLAPLLFWNMNNFPFPAQAVTPMALLTVFSKVAPLPFFVMAVKQFVKEKKIVFLLLIVFSFLGAWLFGVRALHLLGILTIIGFSRYFKTSNHKRLWLVLSVVWFVFILWRFVSTFPGCV